MSNSRAGANWLFVSVSPCTCTETPASGVSGELRLNPTVMFSAGIAPVPDKTVTDESKVRLVQAPLFPLQPPDSSTVWLECCGSTVNAPLWAVGE